MSDSYVPRVGGILSADIAVPEHEREVRFYARVLGTGEAPLWREDLMNNLGMPIIGLGERVPEYAGLPMQWMVHIQVEDVAASAARAVALGGTEVMHGKDEQGASQWAVLKDPQGAAFGIMPVVPAEAMPSMGEGAAEGSKPDMGHIAWADLTVADATATRNFYREVVGWTAEDVAMEDGDGNYADFKMLAADGHPAAGICHARGGNLDIPPVWMLYLPVGDLEASLRLVEEEGGKILKAPRGADGNCSIAVIEDPVGVCLALAQG